MKEIQIDLNTYRTNGKMKVDQRNRNLKEENTSEKVYAHVLNVFDNFGNQTFISPFIL